MEDSASQALSDSPSYDSQAHRSLPLGRDIWALRAHFQIQAKKKALILKEEWVEVALRRNIHRQGLNSFGGQLFSVRK